ncbi:prolipoprotein diacylglyceryl transferase [Weeksellaceae bacterium TAE3-ERU29]|nr:prolipoprotein diacylglyceryl transferase [Weeksellaceae bacterium TAE3-ERU29]
MDNLLAYITWGGSGGIDILGWFTLHFYSLMWLMAFVVGWFIMAKMFKKDGVSKELLDPLFMYSFFGAILGARLGEYLFYDPSAFIDKPLEVFLPIQHSPGDEVFFGLIKDYKFVGFQGLASHGATLGLIISSYLYTKKYLPRKNILWLLDRMAICAAIGGAFVRIGNFANSEIIGKPSDMPWAVLFERQSLSYGEIVPRHPAQLYEAISYIILFVILWHIYKKTNKKYQNGYILGLFFTILFTIRFIVEFFKESQGVEWVAQTLNIDLNNGQVLSIPFIIAGIFVMYYSKNFRNEKN